jgi:hypothetical protein
MQRRTLAMEPVEIAHQVLHAAMQRIVERPERDLAIMPPLGLLPELLPHEQQLLAWMRPHESVVGTQVREFGRAIARHPAEDGALAVDDLVMAQRQDESLGERIVKSEAHLGVVRAAMHRVLAHILPGVVHPAHVPFEAEAQAVPSAGRVTPGQAVDSSAMVIA